MRPASRPAWSTGRPWREKLRSTATNRRRTRRGRGRTQGPRQPGGDRSSEPCLTRRRARTVGSRRPTPDAKWRAGGRVRGGVADLGGRVSDFMVTSPTSAGAPPQLLSSMSRGTALPRSPTRRSGSKASGRASGCRKPSPMTRRRSTSEGISRGEGFPGLAAGWPATRFFGSAVERSISEAIRRRERRGGGGRRDGGTAGTARWRRRRSRVGPRHRAAAPLAHLRPRLDFARTADPCARPDPEGQR